MEDKKMGSSKEFRIGCMFWNYLANRTQQLVEDLWKRFDRMGVSATFYLGTENHFYFNDLTSDAMKYDYQYSALSSYSRYESFDLLIVSGGTLTISRSREEADRVLDMLPKVPTIFLENPREKPGCASLVLDNAGGIRQCTEHLIEEHGCRRIAFIAGPKDNTSAKERKQAFYKTMEDHGLSVDEKDVIQGNFGEAMDDLVEPLFANGSHPDAIVSANDEMALCVYRIAEKHGLKVGKDVLLTGFDDISVAAYLDPPLTTVRQDFNEMSDEIVDVAMKMLRGEDPGPHIYRPRFIPRGSCGCSKCQESGEIEKTVPDHEKLVGSFVNLQKMRQSILSGATMNRAMLNAPDMISYRYMIASVMEIERLKGARLLLADPYMTLRKRDPIVMPEELKLSVECVDGKVTVYEEGKEPRYYLDRPEKRTGLPGGGRPPGCSVVFLLFFEEHQYGILELEIDLSEIEHFYMAALEIGVGLRYQDLISAEREAREELEEKNRKLDFAAYHDALTGVHNRNGFLQQERVVINDHIGSSVAVLMADLDHLKQINDAYGHREGDRAIKLTSDALEEILGRYDAVIGRTGGDEFSAIFPVEEDFDAAECVEEIHRYCEEFNKDSDLPYFLGISAGCLKFKSREGIMLRELFTEADVLLYADKKRRRMMVLKEGKID